MIIFVFSLFKPKWRESQFCVFCVKCKYCDGLCSPNFVLQNPRHRGTTWWCLVTYWSHNCRVKFCDISSCFVIFNLEPIITIRTIKTFEWLLYSMKLKVRSIYCCGWVFFGKSKFCCFERVRCLNWPKLLFEWMNHCLLFKNKHKITSLKNRRVHFNHENQKITLNFLRRRIPSSK